ncbi:MAG: biotin/lipoyl-containing protein [Candidatus Poseidoniia archaeon]|jgi:glycine cleavage system H protein|nr:biotin/lipoyl-containing protein [Candidatus Poseidoniia archaeon]|tara:strand:- start:830 stop:1291 length:462 start_codon:yes stop_codon:yes gene_type:complete
MALVRNCLLPSDLLYDVPTNIWVRELDDGTVEIGMTDIAQTLAGSIIHCRPKKVGKKVKKGKSVATVESGKWVGPVRSPFAGNIAERNDAVADDATILNRSPYGEGWIVRIAPADLEGDRAGLVGVEEAITLYEDYMQEKELASCIHCEGFEE